MTLFQELPAGCRSVPLQSVFAEEGRARLREASRVLGTAAARHAARLAGRYELDEESRRIAGLAGAALAENGELPVLSPERWLDLPEPVAEAQGRVVGILLTESQAARFERFLAENRVGEVAPDRAMVMARHFFFAEPVHLVIR